MLYIHCIFIASEKKHNKCMKWIREPVALFEEKTSKSPPEPLTTYAGRYMQSIERSF